MFKYWSLKKYGTKLLPLLEKRYGKQHFYSRHQIRATIYQGDFEPQFLPLGYLLFLKSSELNNVLVSEFPGLDIQQFRTEILEYLDNKQYQGYLEKLYQHAS
ncbi:DUF6559 family protein [Thalassotalea atypica]|uniref:DUF6559 family protein n=1 Tax=Thalassotalea atypica TaxID=2054316 RepID=UPI0025732143|nr:DUF6559 family protein [Thalassotalea atypica]